MNESNIKPNGLALLPILVFLILFLGTGIVLKDFYTMPAVVGFLIALIVAFAQTKGRSFNEKLSIVAKGVGDDNIITMCLIFLAAGAFPAPSLPPAAQTVRSIWDCHCFRPASQLLDSSL